MRRVEPAESVDAPEQLGGDALHHPMHLPKNIGMQPAKIRHPRRGAHTAEKTVALDQQRAPARACGSNRCGDPGGSAAEDDDFVLAVERDLAGGFGDTFRWQVWVPRWWVG